MSAANTIDQLGKGVMGCGCLMFLLGAFILVALVVVGVIGGAM